MPISIRSENVNCLLNLCFILYREHHVNYGISDMATELCAKFTNFKVNYH